MDRMLTSVEVAKYLHIHRNTLMKIPHERLPFVRISTRGDRRYLMEDIKKYLQSNEREYNKGGDSIK